MSRDSDTRSGLLWEVERLLKEVDNLPQILLMENVPQVHSKTKKKGQAKSNMENFEEWMSFLESKGYTNVWQDLNSKDYGVAQNRNRCFMVSFLGNYTYKFPAPNPTRKCIKDYLEDKVDEKYYITNDKAKILIDKLIVGGKILTDRQTDRQKDSRKFTPKPIGHIGTGGERGIIYSTDAIAMCQSATQYKDANKICETTRIY